MSKPKRRPHNGADDDHDSNKLRRRTRKHERKRQSKGDRPLSDLPSDFDDDFDPFPDDELEDLLGLDEEHDGSLDDDR